LESLQPAVMEPPDQVLAGSEKLAVAADQANAVFAALEGAAVEMGPKEKEVAAIMLRIIRSNARWPTAGRIHEELLKTDKTLRESTVKDRRKEVMKKFNPILNSYGRNPIGD
jgi:hypothetical protein